MNAPLPGRQHPADQGQLRLRLVARTCAVALHDYGIRAILAPSYADIFHNNCFNNGMLPIRLPGDVIEQLFKEVRANEGYTLTVDLPRRR